MGKKSKNTDNDVQPEVASAGKRPKLTREEKKKLYIAGGMMLVMFIVGYFTMKSIFVTYNKELGGDWQLKSVVQEKTDHPYQAQVGLRLATDDMDIGPEASYQMVQQDALVQTAEGDVSLPELGAYRVELRVKNLTVWPEVAEALSQGALDIYKEDGTQGILKKLQAFVLSDEEMLFCFGFDEEPVVSAFESTNRHVLIQFEPASLDE